ncbi:maleylpyruvate isomerase family mycothiol-dependent enzyme [Streptomyces specialis]|uniref:maleylpyruvate isomerase family mycothiol-dependent enzyme n=1 Tax=Streptomyces specialis TaxID=498367 RepID=UPI00073F4394|nr:maleylpyruvate isomerase family mycothiol-dependent enzyme [Streptomyces specialis]
MNDQRAQDDFAWLGPPVDARPLFRPERARLVADLRALAPADWETETVPGWTVRDMAAHVLGDDYGRISRDRDGHRGPGPRPGEALEPFIHRANQQWVDACARLSPEVLVQTLTLTGDAVADLWENAAPGRARLGVSWAGADPAPLWLDRARDLTEYWTHRQQIRHAAGLPTDADPRHLGPVLDTFLRALPHTLRAVPAPAGTQVSVTVDGPAGGTWTATSTGRGWTLAEPAATPAATVALDPETAWRLCVRAIEPGEAAARGTLGGDRELAEAACGILSIIR